MMSLVLKSKVDLVQENATKILAVTDFSKTTFTSDSLKRDTFLFTWI